MALLRTMKQLFFLLIFTSPMIFNSCDRIKYGVKRLANKTDRLIKDQSNQLLDKIFPRFDANEPDTKYNKKRFTEFIKIDITSDVRNIYCFADVIGIDADYMFSFNCNTTTVRKIIDKHLLKLDKETTDYAFGIQDNFKWWDKEKIKKLELYSWNDGKQYFKYFWYDKTESKAYFFDFDL